MLFIDPGVGGADGRCHTPSGQVPVKCTAGSPETRCAQTVWAACPPFAFNWHYDRRLTWHWPLAPPTPTMFVAMRIFLSNNFWKTCPSNWTSNCCY